MNPMFTEEALRAALRADYQPTLQLAYNRMTEAERGTLLGRQVKAAIDSYVPSLQELLEANEQARDAQQWEASKQHWWAEHAEQTRRMSSR